MKTLIVILIACAGSPLFAQRPQDFLWMRVAGPSDVITSLTASQSSHSIYSTSLGGEWGFWSLQQGLPSIRDRFDFSRKDAYCAQLNPSSSELLSGVNGIVAWNPISNIFT